MKKLALVFLILPSLLAGCTATNRRALLRWDASVNDYLYFPSRNIEAGTFVRQFRSQPSAKVEAFFAKAFQTKDLPSFVNKTGTQALIVVKGEDILVEEYGKGYDKNSTVTSFSVAKSIDSAIIGALIDGNKISSVDESITKYIPELLKRDERFSRITIRHLLCMSSGIVYKEDFPRKDNTQTYFNPDLRNLAINNTLIEEEPGLHFLYNNYNPLLLGLVIERACGGSVSSYFSKSIWSKIGAEEKASWSLDSEKSAFEKMESGVNARAMDFVRFGCMYRDGGKVFGTRVLSKKWIDESLRESSDWENSVNDEWGRRIAKGVSAQGGYYGYFWYVLKRSGAENDFFAFGNKGQVIYVSPAANLVCARFGKKDGIPVWNYIQAFYDLASKTLSERLSENS